VVEKFDIRELVPGPGGIQHRRTLPQRHKDWVLEYGGDKMAGLPVKFCAPDRPTPTLEITRNCPVIVSTGVVKHWAA